MVYTQCTGVKITKNYANFGSEKVFNFSGLYVSESGKSCYSGSCYQIDELAEDRVIEVDPSGVLSLESGRKLVSIYGELIDITDIVGDDEVVAVEYFEGFLLASGKFIYFDLNGPSTDDSLTDILGGAKVKQYVYYHQYDYNSKLILLDDGSLFTVDIGWGGLRHQNMKPIDIPPVDKIENNIIYLKDGSVYGYINNVYKSRIVKIPQYIEGAKITNYYGNNDGLFFYPYTTHVASAEDGRLYTYTSAYDINMEYLFTLESGEKVTGSYWIYEEDVGASLDISDLIGEVFITNLGRAIEIRPIRDDYYQTPSGYEVADITSEVSGFLPSVSTPQIKSLFFGNNQVTNFEVLDNNTIRAIVPPNLVGSYSVSI